MSDRNLKQAKKLQKDLEIELDAIECITGGFETAFELSLIGTINSLSRSIILLFEAYPSYDLNILLRSLLEHIVELKLLRQFPERHRNKALEFQKGLLNALSEGQKGNPFAASIGMMSDLTTQIDETRSKANELKGVGAKKTTRVADWTLVGLGEMYEVVYRNLSQFAHPEYSGGITRNLTSSNDLPTFHISSNSILKDEAIATLFDALCGTLQEAIDIIKELKKSSA